MDGQTDGWMISIRFIPKYILPVWLAVLTDHLQIHVRYQNCLLHLFSYEPFL